MKKMGSEKFKEFTKMMKPIETEMFRTYMFLREIMEENDKEKNLNIFKTFVTHVFGEFGVMTDLHYEIYAELLDAQKRERQEKQQ